MRHSARTQYGVDWQVPDSDGAGSTFPDGSVHTVLLMEIRDELKTLNRLLGCSNFIGIPTTLRAIQRNTTKRRRAKKGAAS